MLSGLIYVFAFILVLSIVVIVHEGGHFFMARLCGVKVTDFSLGFGKTLWSRMDKNGTTWRVCAIPMGGYVKMLGDEDAASAKSSVINVSDDERKYTFMAQPLYKRALIIFAGPLMNYVFAIFLLTGLFWFVGEVKIPPVVGAVVAESAAEKAGLKVGDLIISVNETPVRDYTDLQRAIRITQYGKTLSLQVKRDKEYLFIEAAPVYDAGSKIPKLGILSSPKLTVINKDISFLKAGSMALYDVYRITVDTLIYLKQILFDKRSADDMRGPLGIAEASGDAFQGGALSLLIFIIQISVAIGFMNLLPIPVLDGGHLAMYAVEAVIRKPLSDQIRNVLLWGGVSILMALLVYTFFLDIPRITQRIFE